MSAAIHPHFGQKPGQHRLFRHARTPALVIPEERAHPMESDREDLVALAALSRQEGAQDAGLGLRDRTGAERTGRRRRLGTQGLTARSPQAGCRFTV